MEEKWLHWLHEYFTGRINYIHARLRLHWGKNYNKISFQLKLLIKPSRKRKETQNDLFVQHCRCAGVVNVNKSRRMNNLFARKLRQTLAIMSYPLRRWKMMKMMNMHDVRQEHKSFKKMSGIWLDVFPFHVDTSWLILFRGWNIAIVETSEVFTPTFKTRNVEKVFLPVLKLIDVVCCMLSSLIILTSSLMLAFTLGKEKLSKIEKKKFAFQKNLLPFDWCLIYT